MVVQPGDARAYDEAEWRGALVVVEQGAVELECERGGRRRFERGDVMWLDGLRLRALHNPGDQAAVLVAIARRRAAPDSDRADDGDDGDSAQK